MRLFYGLIFLLFLFLFSCQGTGKVESILQKWQGKEILFPDSMVFTIRGNDTVNFSFSSEYKILSYIDSIGCTSCKLGLGDWKEYISEMNSLLSDSVKFLFFFFPKDGMEIYQMLRVNRFGYPICMDYNDELNSLNHFPSDERFQTFLLDKDNRVLAVGNPIHNPKIKELYLKIIRGETVQEETGTSEPLTSIQADRTSADLGSFARSEEQKVVFNLKNTGRHLLVVHDVTTSCGCITVDYPKEPVRPDDVLPLTVTYRADEAGYFSKTATVHCNAEGAPLVLNVKGTATP